MPSRPSNINPDMQSAAHVLNQSVREINQRIDVSNQQISRTQYLTELKFGKGFTIGNGSKISKEIQQVSSISFGAIPANSGVARVITVNGALASAGTVFASPMTTLGNSNLAWSAWVSAPNTVEVRVINPTTGVITPNVVKWSVWCRQ